MGRTAVQREAGACLGWIWADGKGQASLSVGSWCGTRSGYRACARCPRDPSLVMEGDRAWAGSEGGGRERSSGEWRRRRCYLRPSVQ